MSGWRRIVFLSSPYKTARPFFQKPQPNAFAQLHAEIERLIEMSGRQWTFLRPGMFAANVLWWWAQQIRAGHPAFMTSEVAEITGVPARTFRKMFIHRLHRTLRFENPRNLCNLWIEVVVLRFHPCVEFFSLYASLRH